MSIIPLFAVIGKFSMLYESMMQQTTQVELLKQALNAEVANVIAVVAVFLAIVIVIIVRTMNARQKSEDRVMAFLFGEKSPIVIAMDGVKSAILDNKKAQDTTANGLAQLASKTDEQTTVLREQNTLLTNFKNFQKLNNDQVADVGNKVETLSKSVTQNTESIAESIEIIKRVETKIDELTLKHLDCIDLKADIAALRKLIEDRQTPPVILPNANVIADTEQPQAGEGAA